jgi:hypothetical protein
LTPLGLEFGPLGRPARSQPLYRQRYRGFFDDKGKKNNRNGKVEPGIIGHIQSRHLSLNTLMATSTTQSMIFILMSAMKNMVALVTVTITDYCGYWISGQAVVPLQFTVHAPSMLLLPVAATTRLQACGCLRWQFVLSHSTKPSTSSRAETSDKQTGKRTDRQDLPKYACQTCSAFK